MALLTAQEIESADDLLYEDVPCPEWGGEVPMVTLTGPELDAFREDYKRANDEHYRKGHCEEITNKYVFLSHVCRDRQTRQRLFPDASVLEKKAGAVTDRLFSAAVRLNGYGADEKNSPRGVSGGTDTPATSA